MDFDHTEERRMLADTVGRYLAREYPLAERNAAAGGDLGFDSEKWAALADLGVIGVLFPEDLGGFGGRGYDLAVVFEALGRGLVVEPLLDGALLPGAIFAAAGETDRLAAIIAGSARYALATEEAGGRYDPTRIATRATGQDGGWRLTGAKTVVKFAAAADGLVVSARTAGEPGDAAGVALFLVAPGDAMLRGYTTIDGGRAAELALDATPAKPIGAAGQGLALLEAATARGLVALSAEALGIMERIKEMTLDYLRQRRQFGIAIGGFQALQHRMAQLVLEITQARSAVINAAAALDKAPAARDAALSAAKVSIGRIGALVAEEAIQMHGGIGMTWDYDLGHFAKRLVLIDHELGDEDHHLARYIALTAP